MSVHFVLQLLSLVKALLALLVTIIYIIWSFCINYNWGYLNPLQKTCDLKPEKLHCQQKQKYNLRPERFQRQRQHSMLPLICHTNNQSSSGIATRTPGQSEKEILHEFIKKLVNTFHDQRKPGRFEFAVLLLSPGRNITDLINVEFRIGKGKVNTGCLATDKYAPVFPVRDRDLCNYVTSRPDSGNHAESLILFRLNKLMYQYEIKNQPKCQTILLYTTLSPCSSCKTEIIRTLGPFVESHRVMVIYTVPYTKNDPNDTTEHDEVVQELKEAGIEVRRVKCFVPSTTTHHTYTTSSF